MPTSCLGLTPSSRPAAIVARKHDVPDALSQLSVNTAPYGAGAVVTGGVRVIKLCRAGTFSPFSTLAFVGRNAGSKPLVQRSIAALVDGSPHARTNTTSSAYGSHAMT